MGVAGGFVATSVAEVEGGISPGDSLKLFEAPDDIAIDLIAHEPEVVQPSFIRFDERGRMWVVQYRQYPLPAGLSIASRDEFWRNVYDQVPAAPGAPDHVPGADRITIHEDTNGDGRFDMSKVFLDGLSLATSVAWDRDGVWVLQAPYLLYYKDANHDDVVDGPPEVVLSGFGIEDSHAIVNSLTWGPDGWLYGAQGSTVTGNVSVAGSSDAAIQSVGQLMWRFHPRKRIYEIFAEGGGNIWSCQFDSKGRLFAGTNQGKVVGYHYMQGSYSHKWFTKHGQLSNPFTYGYFKGIAQSDLQRVTTNLMIYEERGLPERFRGALLSSNPLVGEVLASELISRGPSFQAKRLEPILEGKRDLWARPVYVEAGPDGAVYLADWYDEQVNHFLNNEGRISPIDGRIYRIRSADAYEVIPADFDMGALSSGEWVAYLRDERRWYRDTARRLIHTRGDRSELRLLKKGLETESGQTALEYLWAINLLDGFDEKARRTALGHADPHVRVWGVRLIGDEREARPWEIEKMAAMAASDGDIEVRQQLASTAKRLIGSGGLRIAEQLMTRDEDAADDYMPLMVWWALEAACGDDPAAVVALFEEEGMFARALVRGSLLGFTMRRLASEGSREYLGACARLFQLSPNEASKEILVTGFEEAYRGRSMVGLPRGLLDELSAAGGKSVAMQLRQEEAGAEAAARSALMSEETDAAERQRIVEALGDTPRKELLDALLLQLENGSDGVVEATLSTLLAYDDAAVGEKVLELYPSFGAYLQSAAQTLLQSRAAWALSWVRSVESGELGSEAIPAEALVGMGLLSNETLDALIDRIWKREEPARGLASEEIRRFQEILGASERTPDVYKGRDHYMGRCGMCHRLHDEGGAIGPELTGYQRHDRGSLLLAIVDPNAEIREGFETYVVRTKDGLTLSGFITDRDEHVVALKPMGGQTVVLEQGQIESMEGAEASLMPAGLLAGLDDQALVDLFAYLQSSQPLNLKKE